MDLIISLETMFPDDNPRKTSAPFIASSSVFKFLSDPKNAFSLVKLSLSFLITPLLSSIIIFDFLAPSERYNLAHDMAAAPAPLMTI